MLDKFPVEIISEIFWHLSIKDVRSCKKIYNSTKFYKNGGTEMHDAYKDRLSIQLYLAQTFPDSNKLLEHMKAYDAWISGSRALDFFAGDSTDSDSDWDFYIPTDNYKPIYFMKYMESIGVHWISTIEYYIDKINNSSDPINISYDNLLYLSRSDDSTIPNYIKENMQSMIDVAENNIDDETTHVTQYELTRPDDTICYIRISEDAYGDTGITDIIRGRLLYRNTQTSIQLILTGAYINSNIDTIRQFDLSIVQCAITGFMAFHMYSNHAYDKLGSVWKTNNLSKNQEALVNKRTKKYGKRGYTFLSCSTNFNSEYLQENWQITRCIGDPQSDVIYYKPNKILAGDKTIPKKRQVYNYKWLESSTELNTHFANNDQKYDQFQEITRYLKNNSIYLSANNETAIIKILNGSSIDIDIPDNYRYPDIDFQYYMKFRALVNSYTIPLSITYALINFHIDSDNSSIDDDNSDHE